MQFYVTGVINNCVGYKIWVKSEDRPINWSQQPVQIYNLFIFIHWNSVEYCHLCLLQLIIFIVLIIIIIIINY